jgi:hypothetical protein
MYVMKSLFMTFLIFIPKSKIVALNIFLIVDGHHVDARPLLYYKKIIKNYKYDVFFVHYFVYLFIIIS